MNPTRPPIPPYNGRPFSSETMTNPLYGMHINATGAFGAGPSTQPAQPGSSSSPTSFYPPHLTQHSKPARPPPLMPKPPALAPLPPSLMPGSGARSRADVLSSLESSLFFQPNTAPLPSPSISPTITSSHPYSHGSYASSAPALPPKPPLIPHLQAHSHRSLGPFPEGTAPKIPLKHFSTPGRLPPRAPVPVSPVLPDNDEFVARALELSLQDSGPFAHSDLEDDILARVLEESLASINTPTAHDTRAQPNTSSPRPMEEGNSNAEPQSASSSSSSSSRSFVETPATSYFSHSIDTDNAVGEKGKHASLTIDVEELARQEQEQIRAVEEARRKQMEMDEEFARNLARMEASSSSGSPMHQPVSPGISSGALLVPSSDGTSRPPLYNEALRRPSSFHAASSSQQNQPYQSTSHIAPASAPNIISESRPLPSPKGAPLGRSHASYSAPLPSFPSVEKLGRSISAQASIPSSPAGASTSSIIAADRAPIIKSDSRPNAVIPAESSRASPEGIPSTPKARPKVGLDGLMRGSSADSSVSTSPSLEKVKEREEDEDDLLSIMSPTSEAEHDEGRMMSNTPPSSAPIVEEELLMGVSFGFNAPSMAYTPSPMQGPIPNIIALPYGKCPPLHIQAPTWKHLLKLLTRLSESRIEPTVEALAGTKSDLRLRTVIQFMKVHHSSDDWRTIVYLTIDTPIPPQTPNIFKYTNGDVTTFPYSYTTSPLPALLRAGAGDSNLSKCFTVPSTASTPYPTLPLSLPDFAMYLHSVLENSRRASGDSSGGLRKLAKMVDNFYPADAQEGLGPEFMGPDKRGVGGFFRRALGRGNKDGQNQRGGNAERFEFITPFRIDEYR